MVGVGRWSGEGFVARSRFLFSQFPKATVIKDQGPHFSFSRKVKENHVLLFPRASANISPGWFYRIHLGDFSWKTNTFVSAL